jgi:hypothetical protein
MTPTGSQLYAGMGQIFTVLPVIALAIIFPIVAGMVAASLVPNYPQVAPAVVLGGLAISCFLTWRVGRWMVRRAGPGVDLRLAVLGGAAMPIWSFLKTDQGTPIMVASLIMLSLPAVTLWLSIWRSGADHRPEGMVERKGRERGGRLRFLLVWVIFAAIYAGLVLSLILLRPMGLAFSAAVAVIVTYVVVVSIMLWFLGRFLRRRWQDRPVHPVLIAIPLLLTALPLLRMTGAAASSIAFAAFDTLLPPAAFALGLLAGRRSA